MLAPPLDSASAPSKPASGNIDHPIASHLPSDVTLLSFPHSVIRLSCSPTSRFNDMPTPGSLSRAGPAAYPPAAPANAGSASSRFPNIEFTIGDPTETRELHLAAQGLYCSAKPYSLPVCILVKRSQNGKAHPFDLSIDDALQFLGKALNLTGPSSDDRLRLDRALTDLASRVHLRRCVTRAHRSYMLLSSKDANDRIGQMINEQLLPSERKVFTKKEIPDLGSSNTAHLIPFETKLSNGQITVREKYGGFGFCEWTPVGSQTSSNPRLFTFFNAWPALVDLQTDTTAATNFLNERAMNGDLVLWRFYCKNTRNFKYGLDWKAGASPSALPRSIPPRVGRSAASSPQPSTLVVGNCPAHPRTQSQRPLPQLGPAGPATQTVPVSAVPTLSLGTQGMSSSADKGKSRASPLSTSVSGAGAAPKGRSTSQQWPQARIPAPPVRTPRPHRANVNAMAGRDDAR